MRDFEPLEPEVRRRVFEHLSDAIRTLANNQNYVCLEELKNATLLMLREFGEDKWADQVDWAHRREGRPL